MSTDERSESLAAQAAAWVPPWERQRPDAAAADAAPATERPGDPTAPAEPSSGDTARADDAAILPTDADGVETDPETDADAGPDTEIDPVPPELAPIPGEVTGPVTVDAPQVLPGEREPEPTDVGVPPELPVPGALEAAEEADPDRSEPGSPVDAPTPFGPDDDAVADDDDPSAPAPADDAAVGVDAGAGAEDDAAVDAFAADHDISDDGRADQPLSSEVSADAVIPPGAVSPPGEPDPDTPGGSGGAPAPFGMFPQGGRRAGTAAPAPAPRRGTPRTTVPGAEADAGTELAPTIDDTELRAALEAVLLVVDEPVAEMQLAQIMEQPTERVAAMLEDISAGYTAAGHGFDLRRAAGGWRLYTRTEYAAYVERFVLDGQSVRLTQAALETLAVIAYKQPVTRSRISVIRGVNCDGVMRTLVTRGLIEECGTESETGAFLYRTTVLFLEKLGLNSVDQLPPLAPFLPDDVEEVIDAQR